MTIDWKKPEGPFAIKLQEMFMEFGEIRGSYKQTIGAPNPSKAYVYTSEQELAAELGITVEELGEDDYEDVVPPNLQQDFFYAYVKGRGNYVFCTDEILTCHPK